MNGNCQYSSAGVRAHAFVSSWNWHTLPAVCPAAARASVSCRTAASWTSNSHRVSAFVRRFDQWLQAHRISPHRYFRAKLPPR